MRPAKAAVAAEAPSSAAVENGAVVSGMARPDTMGRFGRFGGKYVPETLMHALTELENAFHALATDEEFQVTTPPARLSIPLRTSCSSALRLLIRVISHPVVGAPELEIQFIFFYRSHKRFRHSRGLFDRVIYRRCGMPHLIGCRDCHLGGFDLSIASAPL
jgi:hypothetical protein